LLFLRHRDRLWAVALRTLADADEAADALQDAMISAFRRAADFRGESAVTTWLHRIVVNACLDRMRRKAARPATNGMDERALDALARGPACWFRSGEPCWLRRRCASSGSSLARPLAHLLFTVPAETPSSSAVSATE
jgi:RNA polymerase sigma factor (sigma-70 family)